MDWTKYVTCIKLMQKPTEWSLSPEYAYQDQDVLYMIKDTYHLKVIKNEFLKRLCNINFLTST